MPVIWTCDLDGHTSTCLDDHAAHERDAHDGRPTSRTLTITRRRGVPRRTWSCAACAGQVDRPDDGSMLCDDCKARRTTKKESDR